MSNRKPSLDQPTVLFLLPVLYSTFHLSFYGMTPDPARCARMMAHRDSTPDPVRMQHSEPLHGTMVPGPMVTYNGVPSFGAQSGAYVIWCTAAWHRARCIYVTVCRCIVLGHPVRCVCMTMCRHSAPGAVRRSVGLPVYGTDVRERMLHTSTPLPPLLTLNCETREDGFFRCAVCWLRHMTMQLQLSPDVSTALSQ